MPDPSLSAAIKEAYASAPTDTVILHTLELRHPDFVRWAEQEKEPLLGTAIAGCREVFGNGGKACVLYCLNGQICPDGMQCASGTCYWPN